MKSELELSLYKVNKEPKKQYSFTDKEYKKAADFMQQIKIDCTKALSSSKRYNKTNTLKPLNNAQI